MGNNICSCQYVQHQNSQHIKTLQAVKTKVLTLYIQSQFKCKTIQSFFHSDLIELVQQFQYTGAQKIPSQKPIPSHYDTFLNNVYSIEDTDCQRKSTSDDIARQAYLSIREQLIVNQKNLVILIISKYFLFLENYLTSQQDASNSTHQGYFIAKQNYLPATQLTYEAILKVINNLNIQQIESLVDSIAIIFKTLRLLTIYLYQDILSTYFTNNVEAKPQFEISIQRVIQFFLFTKDGVFKQMFQPVIHRYYSQKYSKVKEDVNEKIKFLDKRLIPISSFRLWDQPDARSTSIYEQARKYSSPQITPKIRMQNIVDEEYSEIVQINTKEANIPYQETFQIIVEIIEELKLWRKYILIESFNQMIIDLYLFKRSSGQMEDFLEIINAEDNKSEIQAFILQRFFEQNHQYDVFRDLFVSIKLMYDFDEILDEKIKFMFSPAFLRFYTLVELMINKKNY